MCRWFADVSRKGFVLMALVGCASDPATPPPPDPCDGVVTSVPLLDSPHVPEGSAPTWNSNPPTSGPHYPVWAAYDQHYENLPRGYWLHDLEHRAVVYSYRCDAGCPDVAAQLDAVVQALPADSECAPPVRQRALVVADPLLPDDNTVAAVAWGTFYIGQCADAATLKQFYFVHHGHGPEDICTDGAAFSGAPL